MATHHVIVGAGPVATNAIETLRDFETTPSQITLISDEPAHSRMALPYWLAGQVPRLHTHTGDDEYFQRLNVETRFGSRVASVDTSSQKVVLDDGTEIGYDNLLLGTGSSPVQPDIPGIDLPGVQPLWSLEHTQRVLDYVGDRERPRVALIGAGFIGFIVLNAMFKRGWQLAVIEREPHVLPKMLDAPAAEAVEKWLDQRGVAVHTGATVTEIRENAADDHKIVTLENGQEVIADVVIVATGIRPNLDLIQGAGIQTNIGVLVNDQMQTNMSNVYAGGDIVEGPALFSDKPAIHAIQPTAVDHGRVAGANMAGHEVHYGGSLLMNVVDVCGLQTASFGNWDDDREITTILNQDGCVYRKYVWEQDQITGAIFLGRPSDMGMLNDVGMVKGILQTQTPLGDWKAYLQANPFDVRRAYVAAGVPQKLVNTTLLGRPSKQRGYRFGDPSLQAPRNDALQTYVGTKPAE